MTAIVVNYRRPQLLRACLDSLTVALARVDGETEIVVVDNGSGDESAEMVRSAHPQAVVIDLAENRGFGGAVNVALERARGEMIFLLNNDATCEPDAVAELVRVLKDSPDLGSVAAQMRFADRPRTINSAGIELDLIGVAADRLFGLPIEAGEQEPVEVFGASGGAALWRRSALDSVGGFHEPYFLYLEDVDLAWRAQMRGWRARYAPRAVVYHEYSATAGDGSPFKYRWVGRNRVRLVARNANRRQLLRYGPAMIVHDVASVGFQALRNRTLAPLHGRLEGLLEWRSARRSGASGRRTVALAPARGLRDALARRRAWSAAVPQHDEKRSADRPPTCA